MTLRTNSAEVSKILHKYAYVPVLVANINDAGDVITLCTVAERDLATVINFTATALNWTCGVEDCLLVDYAPEPPGHCLVIQIEAEDLASMFLYVETCQHIVRTWAQRQFPISEVIA